MRRWLLALALLGGVVPDAVAGPQPAPVMPSPVPARVQVQVDVVRATRGSGTIDPRLADEAAALQRTGFQGFVRVDQEVLLLAGGQTGSLVLPDGRTVRVALQRHDPVEAQLQVRAERAGAEPVVTAVTVKRDRAFVLALKTAEPNTALLLLVEVRY